MIVELIIFFITTLVGYYLYIYKQGHNFFKQRNVSYLSGLPFFGNMVNSTLQKRHFVYDLDEVYKAFPDERYVGFMEQHKPIFLIRDPELLKNITVKDFDHFTDHKEFFDEDADPLFGGSLLLMKGERWRHMRNTLTPAFTSSKMKLMFPIIMENANNITQYLNDNQHKSIDVSDLIHRYTNDVIASAGFGLQMNSLKDRDNQFYKTGINLFEFSTKQLLVSMMMVHCPSVAKKLGFRLFPNSTYNFFSKIVADTIEYRKKANVDRPDMIQLLMETSKDWTPDEITSQVFIFFAAGFETTASALSMCIHELALNPEIEDRLYQEIRQFHQDKELTFDSITELKYLDCVLNETLRKWSPALIVDRTCVKTYDLPSPREGGYPCTLKPGDVIYGTANSIQWDEKYYPDPLVFDPDRFSEENKHNIKPYTFMPFGLGPRVCIGLRFAMMELKVLLAQIVLNYKIEKDSKTSDPLLLKPHNFVISAVGGTFVTFKKRL